VGYLDKPDYVVIGVYFAAMIAVGIVLQRKASQNMQSYFLAEKRLPWWMLGVSGMGYSFDVAGTMLIVSLLYILGPRGLYIEFRGGVSLALLCQMLWTGKWHRRSGCMTLAEWMTFRFGETRAADFARVTTAVSFIVFTTSMIIYLAVGTGLFFSLFLPLSPIQCSAIIFGITTAYTAASGLYGVVIGDLLQCGLVIVSALVFIAIAVSQLGTTPDFPLVAEAVTGMKTWSLSFPNYFEPNMPLGYEQYEYLLTYTMFFLVLNKLIINGFGTGHEPQFFAARNERDCGKLACLWSVLMTLRWPMMMACAVLGILLVHREMPDQNVLPPAAKLIQDHVPTSPAHWREVISDLQHHPEEFPPELTDGLSTLLGTDWSSRITLLTYQGTIDAERIVPNVLLRTIPGGLRGLVLVALMAALMSTFDMTMNKSAAMFTNDIYHRFVRPGASNRELLIATYAFCILLVVVSFGLAYNIPNINEIWGWIAMGLWSGIGMPILLRLYWWRFNAAGFVSSMVGGLIAALTVVVMNKAWELSLTEVQQFLLLTPISFFFAVAGTYLASPTEEKVLTRFYCQTRPFGLWKPLESALPVGVLNAMKREHRYDLLALPFGFAWMVSMYLLPMQLLIREWYSAAITAVVFVVGVLGLYRFWYRNLPPETPEVVTEQVP
jgi:solute:Na+ symporter, SSS family